MAKASKAATETVAEPAGSDKKQAQPVEFSEISENGVTASTSQFDILLDMDALVTIALGQAKIPVRRLLQLGPGAVLTLDKTVESPVDLYLQGNKFAEGDVVIVDDCFAVKIRTIIGLQENAEGDSQE